MRVRLPVLVGVDLALANLIAFAPKLGFELGSGHGGPLCLEWRCP
jgi:hypothetical protein